MTAAVWAESWLGDQDARIERLRERAAGHGGPAAQLDLSGASLGPLWALARGQFRRRAPEEPVRPELLPAWFGDPQAWTPQWWDDESIWLGDELIGYLAESVRRGSGAHWDIWESDPRLNDGLEGQPVLIRPDPQTAPWHPWTYTANMVGGIWTGRATDRDLVDLYEMYVGPA